MIVTLQLVLAAGAKRVSDVYGGTAGIPDETKNIPFRQLEISTAGAVATLGGTSAVAVGAGYPLAVAGTPLRLGPFETGPLKLSDLYAVGAGATLTIIGVPF